MIAALIALGADINASDMSEVTPISMVCDHGERDLAVALAAMGADPTIEDENVRLLLSHVVAIGIADMHI